MSRYHRSNYGAAPLPLTLPTTVNLSPSSRRLVLSLSSCQPSSLLDSSRPSLSSAFLFPFFLCIHSFTHLSHPSARRKSPSSIATIAASYLSNFRPDNQSCLQPTTSCVILPRDFENVLPVLFSTIISLYHYSSRHLPTDSRLSDPRDSRSAPSQAHTSRHHGSTDNTPHLRGISRLRVALTTGSQR